MEKMETMPAVFLNDPVFRRLGKVARVAALDKKERREYEQSLKIYRDNYAIMATERSEGFAEGIAEGRAEERANLIRRLMANGMSVVDIANFTGYSSNDIEKCLRFQ